MKQFLTIIMVIGLAFSAQANEPSLDNVGNLAMVDSATVTQLSEAERIVDKYSGKIADTFTKGLNTVVPAAKDGFNMVVKYEQAKGVALLSPFLFFILLMALGTVMTIMARKRDRHDALDTMEGVIGMVAFILAGCAFIVGVITFGDGVMHLIAPEWYAIQEIIELFK